MFSPCVAEYLMFGLSGVKATLADIVDFATCLKVLKVNEKKYNIICNKVYAITIISMSLKRGKVGGGVDFPGFSSLKCVLYSK